MVFYSWPTIEDHVYKMWEEVAGIPPVFLA